MSVRSRSAESAFGSATTTWPVAASISTGAAMPSPSSALRRRAAMPAGAGPAAVGAAASWASGVSGGNATAPLGMAAGAGAAAATAADAAGGATGAAGASCAVRRPASGMPGTVPVSQVTRPTAAARPPSIASARHGPLRRGGAGGLRGQSAACGVMGGAAAGADGVGKSGVAGVAVSAAVRSRLRSAVTRSSSSAMRARSACDSAARASVWRRRSRIRARASRSLVSCCSKYSGVPGDAAGASPAGTLPSISWLLTCGSPSRRPLP